MYRSILTNNTSDDIGVAEPHSQQSRNHLLQDVAPVESHNGLFEEAEDQADDLYVTLIPLKQQLHSIQNIGLKDLIVNRIANVLRSYQ